MRRAGSLLTTSSFRSETVARWITGAGVQGRGMASVGDTDACIVGAARTPMGSFLGSLSSLTAPQLGAAAIRGALERSGLDADAVQEVFMGNVVSAGLGQAPARQAALAAGLPASAPCTQVNKVCASGLKAVMMGALTLQAGLNDVVVAGGMESMSNIPHYARGLRGGLRMGDGALVDGMLQDGLWDAHLDVHMGEIAERCADAHGFTRQQQDGHAVECARRARAAGDAGLLAREIVPVSVPGKRGGPPQPVSEDEPPARFDASKVPTLRPAFRPKGGTVTAANASAIADGAAAVVLTSGEVATARGLKVLARIRGMADAAQAPEHFPTSPALAIRKLLGRAGLRVDEVDYWEVNEAFSLVDLVNQKLLGLSADRVNVHGGAVALGHPIGASGARLLVTLLTVLESRAGRYGVAAICNGGGGASAVLIERVLSQPHDSPSSSAGSGGSKL